MGRTAREVLNELKWRTGYDIRRSAIWVLDRSRPEATQVLSGADIVHLGHRYFTTSRATIPYYKIEKITVEGRVVFERTQ